MHPITAQIIAEARMADRRQEAELHRMVAGARSGPTRRRPRPRLAVLRRALRLA